MKKKSARRKPDRVRHRSPVPRAGGPIQRKGYHRPAARKAARGDIHEASSAPPLRPIEPEEIEQVAWDEDEEE
jgi:hypothetical protein